MSSFYRALPRKHSHQCHHSGPAVGYDLNIAGNYEQQEEAFRELMLSLVLALVLVYMRWSNGNGHSVKGQFLKLR